MMPILEILVLIPSVAALALALILGGEVAAAVLPKKKRDAHEGEAGSVAVVVPAHNEAASIAATLASVRPQLRDIDRVIVVADNCTDETATIAAASGAECWARNDAARRGKGYALQFALDRLKDAPPSVVVFIDADCLVGEGVLQKIARAAAVENRPAQALYLMQAPEDASPRLRIAEFAWLFLNHVRMRGLDRLFGVSRITGAGMALPWGLADALDMASGEIVEDLELTFTLTEKGAPPLLLENAVVTSAFPQGEEAIAKQRARWEHGSQRLAVRRSLPDFAKGLATGNLPLCAVAADATIPPIMNFIAALAAVFLASAVLGLFGAKAPLFFSAPALVIVALALVAAWLRFGMTALPLSSLGGVFSFLAGKRRIYDAEGRRSTRGWTPTRGGDANGQGGR